MESGWSTCFRSFLFIEILFKVDATFRKAALVWCRKSLLEASKCSSANWKLHCAYYIFCIPDPLKTNPLKYILLQSKPCKMFAATLQPSWPSRPQTKGTLLFYFLKLYNFVFNEIFVGSTSSELQHPWISKITTEPKKSRKNRFSGSILKCF